MEIKIVIKFKSFCVDLIERTHKRQHKMWAGGKKGEGGCYAIVRCDASATLFWLWPFISHIGWINETKIPNILQQ